MTTKKSPQENKIKFDYKTIKSFEDACRRENIDSKALPDVSMIPEPFRNAILNVYKLFIIFQAINNGWKPDWSNHNQYKYYPWFEIKASKVLSSGFGFSYSYYGCTYAGTTVGSRLCTENAGKALYIARTFQDEYKEFLLISE